MYMDKNKINIPVMDLDIDLGFDEGNLQLPSPELVSYYQLKRNRMFWINFEIDDYLLEISKQIILINKADYGIPEEERKPIKLYIHTDGGMIEPCMSFLDLMLLSKTPIYTIDMGNALSAGIWIFVCGNKRYCMPNSRALYHSGSGGVGGDFEKVKAGIDEYNRQVEVLRDILLSRTKIDKKLFNKKKDTEWYMDASQMIELGVADYIVSDINEIL